MLPGMSAEVGSDVTDVATSVLDKLRDAAGGDLSPRQQLAAAQLLTAARMADHAVARGDSQSARRAHTSMLECYPLLGIGLEQERAGEAGRDPDPDAELAVWLGRADADQGA